MPGGALCPLGCCCAGLLPWSQVPTTFRRSYSSPGSGAHTGVGHDSRTRRSQVGEEAAATATLAGEQMPFGRAPKWGTRTCKAPMRDEVCVCVVGDFLVEEWSYKEIATEFLKNHHQWVHFSADTLWPGLEQGAAGSLELRSAM